MTTIYPALYARSRGIDDISFIAFAVDKTPAGRHGAGLATFTA